MIVVARSDKQMSVWGHAEATVTTSSLTPEALVKLWVNDRPERSASQSMVLYYMGLNHSRQLLKCRFQDYTQDLMSRNLGGKC